MSKIKEIFKNNKLPFYLGIVLVVLSTLMLSLSLLKRFDEKEKAIRGEKIDLPENELPIGEDKWLVHDKKPETKDDRTKHGTH